MRSYWLLVVGATLAAACSAKAPEAMMSPPPATAADALPGSMTPSGGSAGWVPFDGRVAAEDAGSYTLRTDDGRQIRVSRSDVDVSGSSVRLRIGGHSTTTARPQPTAITLDVPDAGRAARPGPDRQCERSADCDGGCTCCVGLVRVCCDGGAIVGACWGVDDCP